MNSLERIEAERERLERVSRTTGFLLQCLVGVLAFCGGASIYLLAAAFHGWHP